MKSIHTTSRGFTFIETLIALAIMSIIVVVTLSLVTLSISTIRQAKESTTATYLAQDAMEYIIAERDDNILKRKTDKNVSWLGEMENKCTGDRTCIIHTTHIYSGDPHVIEGCRGECQHLNFDTQSGLYQYESVSTTNVPTIYSRQIWIDKVTDDERRAFVKVSWITKGTSHSVTLRTNIFNAK
jgi:prepilin-type N-terminal cleavage/methylation domain-containing protein